MTFKRSSGILLHPTSLPGPFGIGDLGPQAFLGLHPPAANFGRFFLSVPPGMAIRLISVSLLSLGIPISSVRMPCSKTDC